MKKIAVCFAGVVVMLIGLWGGAYAMEMFNWGHWAKFPSLLTAGMVFFVGVAIVSYVPLIGPE